MTALDQLHTYFRTLERRLRLLAATRGLALTAALALLLTLLFVYIGNRFTFAPSAVLPLRIAVYALLGLGIAFLLARPVGKLTRRRVLHLAEQNAPGFEQRLLTVTQSKTAGAAWTELLAEDALRVARQHPTEQFAPSNFFYLFGGGGVVAAVLLLWLIAAGPGYWGYGAGLLWTGTGNASKRPLYDIGIAPGNKTIRRKTDQLVTARLNGFSAEHVNLYVKYGGSLRWDKAPMQRSGDGDQFQFLLAGLSDKVEYYVGANRATSQHYTINVKDLPVVQRVRVALQYPAGLGLENVTLEPSGDIRAVIGTKAEISVRTDRPLQQGQLVLSNGKSLDLVPREDNWLSASLPIEKDGTYHVIALDDNEAIRISDDYIIEARKDEPPSVKIAKPGRDLHVSPIEEMPIAVTASDDFGVQGMDLHYSVNGGPEQVVSLLKNKGAKETEGKTTLAFEDLKVVPGDTVSFYATARDAHSTAHSELAFAQAEPFDFKFSQSQQAGGGGSGMGNQSDDISQKQKQVIAATFNELQDKSKPHAATIEDGKFLSELQSKLGAQAKTLSERMGSRELATPGSQFEKFSQLMTQASSEMGSAAGQLKPGKWSDALAPEQKALTSLLRAESLFRDIQVAYGQMGGGGGGNSAGRDLARMFDLEMDTSKNQYETGQTPQPDGGQQKSQALDAAYERLQQLARRQQELAAQHSQQQAVEQRWQEEQLRREAEELKQQLKQLAENSQQQQQQDGQSGSQSGQQSSGSQGQSGQPGKSQSGSSSSKSGSQSGGSASGQRTTEALQRAGNAVNRAEEEMRKAVGSNDEAARERAANQLREAQEQIREMMRKDAGQSVDEMTRQAQHLAEAQKGLADRMKQMYGSSSGRNGLRNSFGNSPGTEEGESMPEMNDPNSRRYGYGFRRPFNPNQLRPPHQPTEGERSVASEKEQLAAQLEQLQKQMEGQSRNLAGTRPDASSKMSRALSEAESKELALRMQKNAEWIRQGYGDRNLQMEDNVTAGLQQLTRDLKGVQDTLNGTGQSAASQRSGKTAQALAEVQDLRAQLQSQRQRAGKGQAQSGGKGEQGGEGQPTLNSQDVQGAIRELNGLRAQTNPTDRALYGSIDNALGSLQHLTGAQDGLLDARISGNALNSLERLEAELSRRVGQDENAGTRTGTHETSPEKYRDAVAGYFRKLSQSK